MPYLYDELTTPDFVKAVELSAGVCLLPIGILEKHGPHLPLGSDIVECRKVAATAAGQEYSIVFRPTIWVRSTKQGMKKIKQSDKIEEL